MKNKAVKLGIIASILPHLFCCVLPIILSIIGLFAPEISHTPLVPEWIEPWIFVFSALTLIFSWIMVMHDCHCKYDHCNHNHKKQKIILSIVTLLFIISIILHLTLHH